MYGSIDMIYFMQLYVIREWFPSMVTPLPSGYHLQIKCVPCEEVTVNLILLAPSLVMVNCSTLPCLLEIMFVYY